jgi:hypothetical protein
VAHYGALRGSNAYKGHDVILAQVYHPNLEAIIREGRALFADDPVALDMQMTVRSRLLRDGTGATWRIPVPTFADARMAALLENRREAEMLQCALRGRPLDYPESQITLLFSLPLPGLPPTIIVEARASAESNVGREHAVKARLCAAAQQLIEQGKRVIDVPLLAGAGQVSEVTVRKHWAHVAARLHLTMQERRRQAVMPRGGVRTYERQVLVVRGRLVRGWRMRPQHTVRREAAGCAEEVGGTEGSGGATCGMTGEEPTMDQAGKKALMTSVIHHHHRRGGSRHGSRRWVLRGRHGGRHGRQRQHDPPEQRENHGAGRGEQR